MERYFERRTSYSAPFSRVPQTHMKCASLSYYARMPSCHAPARKQVYKRAVH